MYIYIAFYREKGGCVEVKNELQKIAEYQNALLPLHERKTEQAIKDIVDNAEKAYIDKIYNFKNYSTLRLRQEGKYRIVKMYPPFSSEELLCIYLKRVLDKKYHITYPNRNTFIRALFDTLYGLKDMSDYVIFRFDFSDFFNSVSSSFVYEKHIKEAGLERFQADLLSQFVESTEYAYAGLNTSNILCEIVAKSFDSLVTQKFKNLGLILYKRYIDDGIIIFNRYTSQGDCLAIIQEAINEAFYDSNLTNVAPCKVTLNYSKTKYIARRNLTVGCAPAVFDFLGYEFVLKAKSGNRSEKTEFQYGITQKKIEKYTKRINAIVKEYAEAPQKNMELLRHQIKAFTHRTVYRINRYKSVIWKSKGFLSNYCELRYHMDELTPQTERFLKNAVKHAFTNSGITLPYFLKGNNNESIYSLYNNMQKYRTLLFVEMIGIDCCSLKKMCSQIGIDVTTGKSYDGLVRDYLIKVKVGH